MRSGTAVMLAVMVLLTAASGFAADRRSNIVMLMTDDTELGGTMVDRLVVGALAVSSLLVAGPASAADTVKGQVLGGGAPIAKSTVTLWATSASEPKQLGQTQTDGDGRFELPAGGAPGKDAVLYLIAKGGQPTANKASGDNPAIALLTVVGSTPPPKVTINEMTTVASVWTHAQFLDGAAIKGPALSLRIAAGNVPSFVDLPTGGWGRAIQSPFNGGETSTMANFATLADALAGCATRVTANACDSLFIAAAPPKGDVPTDTLTAAQAVARYPWHQPQRLFGLISEFYRFRPARTCARSRSCPIWAKRRAPGCCR